MGKRKTDEEFKQQVYDLIGDEYIFLEKYIDSRTKIFVKHNFCGREYQISPSEFLRGTKCRSCAMKNKVSNGFNGENGIDITGQRFGRLLVKYLIPKEQRKNKYDRREWFCECDCGNSLIVEQRNLLGSKYVQQSCGCLRKPAAFVATTKIEEINLEYVNQFDDYDKYTFLHKAFVKRERATSDFIFYDKFIKYFYNDNQFNNIYYSWLKNKNKNIITFYDWYKPSIDHKIPISRGGSEELENLQFLTVFENLAKRDMTFEEWEFFKKETKTTSEMFIR